MRNNTSQVGNSYITRRHSTVGFTMVELIIIIVVIGIIATIATVGYGQWRTRVAHTEVKSDLNNAISAMENARNFGNVYPNSIPNTFKNSPDVTVTYVYGDDDNFCIGAQSNIDNTVRYFVNNANANDPQRGECPIVWKQISAGYGHTCAISFNNKAYCWGDNSSGQLGSGSTTSSTKPVAVNTSGVLSGKNIRSIVTNSNSLIEDSFSCVVTYDDEVFCWGYNDYGVLGDGSTTQSNVPVAVVMTGDLINKTIKSISAGWYHTCVVASDNNPYCWGRNANGALGNGNYVNSLVPVAVSTSGALAGKTVKSLTLGLYTSCAIASDDRAYCWGNNLYGKLGDGSIVQNSNIPVAVDTSGALSGKTIKSISSFNNTCVVASDNKAYCWGINGSSGMLGIGSDSPSSSNVPVAVYTSGALNNKIIGSVSAGHSFVCVVASNNKAYCWGLNSNGQLGNGSITTSSQPVAVDISGVLSGKAVSSIVTGGTHGCVLDSDNQAYCWGKNTDGQLGNGSVNAYRSTPVMVSQP